MPDPDQSQSPDPDSNTQQRTSNMAARTAIAPLLVKAGAVTAVTAPDGRLYDVDGIRATLKPLAAVHGWRQVFNDYVSLIRLTLSADDSQLPSSQSAQSRGDIEQQYATIAARYSDNTDGNGPHPEAQQPPEAFAASFAELLQLTIETGGDVLGDAYHIVQANIEHNGEYFTPENVSRAMTEMTAPTVDKSVEEPVRVSDPACGSGRLLLDAARAHTNAGMNVHCYGVDNDALCAEMAAINLALANTPAEIIHGDSLSLDVHTVYRVHPNNELGGFITRHDPADVQHHLS